MTTHIEVIVTKASQRLRLIRVLKRSGFKDTNLIEIYCGRIRSVLEYACQVWHPGLTMAQSQDLERIQVRALSIINPELSYWEALDKYKLTTLENRRETLCKKTFEKIKDTNNMLHELLPYCHQNVKMYTI